MEKGKVFSVEKEMVEEMDSSLEETLVKLDQAMETGYMGYPPILNKFVTVNIPVSVGSNFSSYFGGISGTVIDCGPLGFLLTEGDQEIFFPWNIGIIRWKREITPQQESSYQK